MGKSRVYQLAKELNVTSALILELLDLLGVEVKSDLSTLDEGTANLVRERITQAIDDEKRRLSEQAVDEGPGPEALEEPAAPVAVEAVTEAELEELQPAAEVTEIAAELPDEPAASVTAETPGLPIAAAPPMEAPVAPARPEIQAPRPQTPAPRAEMPARPEPMAAASPQGAPGTAAPPGALGPVPPGGRRPPRVFAAQRIPTKAALRATLQQRPAPGIRPGAPPRTPPPFTPARPPRPGPGAGPAPAGPAPSKPGVAKGKKPRKKDKDLERESALLAVAAKPRAELPPVPERISLSEAVTVKELAEKLNRKSRDVIAKLITRGVLATINQPLDPEMAVDVAREFGSAATVLSFEQESAIAGGAASADTSAGETGTAPVTDAPETLRPRPPIVTVMGHVDHGKTSLLDALRETNVVAGESGGITQHIGAYQVELKRRRITFLDTPGHEAFTLMRARGAKVTDIVVLVVAADDGVKPQTNEAIDHARAAGVPIVVAINKVDKPGAQPDRVKQQLADRGLLVEEYGGQTVSCEVSAKKRTGLDELLEMILLVADLQDLKANHERAASGVVLEAKLDRARGVIATVLVQTGTLRAGDPFIAGSAFGKVRAMANEHGQRIDAAGPSTPVEVMGLQGEPAAGDSLQVVADEARARQIASMRQEKARQVALASAGSRRMTFEALAQDIGKGEVKELPIVLKSDFQGSIEALRAALADVPQEKIKINVLRSSTGAITPSDVTLAMASNAVIVGFNVRPERAASDLAKQEGVEIRQYTVIYDVVDDIRQVMVGMLEPLIKETVLGQCEVRQLFRVPKVGVIAGCYVTDGKLTRSAEIRLIRDNVLIYTGRVGSLKRFKDDVSEVKLGYECGVGIHNYNDLKEGDVLEFFVKEKVAAESL